jgi:nucleotide-binding universal stress UspA family protein
MLEKIMVPVDLAHLDGLHKALGLAAEMAKSHDAEVVYVGVYSSLPEAGGPTPDKFPEALKAFANEQAGKHGIKAAGYPVFSHDTTAELTSLLLDAAEDTGADTIVMASHIPGWIEHIFHSNAGYIASHATISVFVVR